MFRRLVWITALVVFAGLAAYFVTRRLMPPVPVAPTAEAKLAWLGREFSLDAAQLARIDALQTAYAPVCEAHCAAIMEAQDTLAASGEDAARRAAAEAELARLKKVCADATRAHLVAVAAVMPPAQASRFLALMEPRVAHTAHRDGAPSLSAAP